MSGHRAVVVGASSGMGVAVAARLRADGMTVAELDLPGARWAGDPMGPRGEIDVADHAGARAAIDGARAALGGLEVLVNCAGILGPVEPVAEVTIETFDRIMAVNLRGAFALTQAALAVMLPAGYGRIVHVASIAGKEGNPGMAVYSASKAGVIGLVKAVGKEHAASGVTVNAIAPAAVDTPLLAGMSAERRARQESLIPMGRLGTVREVADLVAFVVSPGASFTTGFVYDLSGGRADY